MGSTAAWGVVCNLASLILHPFLQQAVEDLGYRLSKPYILKIFDAKMQAHLVQGDFPAIVKLWRKSSPDCQSLLKVCTEEEVVTLAKARVETLVVQSLQAAAKRKKACSRGELVENLSTVASSTTGGGLLTAMDGVMAVTLAVVNHKDTDVEALDRAIVVLDHVLDDDRVIDRNAVYEYLIGPGKKYYDEAVACLASRREEIEAQAELSELQRQGEEILSSDCLEGEILDKLLSFRTKVLAIRKRKKDQQPFATQQLQALEACEASVNESSGAQALVAVGAGIKHAMMCWAEALDADGYIVSDGRETALTGEAIKEMLMPAELSQHGAWAGACAQQPALAALASHCDIMTQVVSAVLSPTKAWTALSHVQAKDVSMKQASAVKPWLHSLHFSCKDIDAGWTPVLDRFANLGLERSAEASKLLKHVVSEFQGGKVVEGVDFGQILEPLPADSTARSLLLTFFEVSTNYNKLATSGASGAAGSLDKVVASLAKLKASLAKITASGQSEESLPAGFDFQIASVLPCVEDMEKKLQEMTAERSTATCKKLAKVAKAASSLVAQVTAASGLDGPQAVGDVTAFRGKMKQLGNKIAAKQVELAALLEQVPAENKAGPSQDEDAAFAMGVNSVCLEYTSIYVAFALWSNKQLKGASKGSLALQANLQGALKTAPAVTIFKAEREEMEQFLDSVSVKKKKSGQSD